MSGDAFWPWFASRCEIQRGSSSRATGRTATSTPACASAVDHAADCEPRQRHQRHVVGVRVRRVRLQRLRALHARLARRDAQVDETAGSEEPEVRVVREERVPAELRLDDEHLALLAARATRRRTDRVAGLQREQRLVAVDHVERRELSFEVAAERLGPELRHGFVAA